MKRFYTALFLIMIIFLINGCGKKEKQETEIMIDIEDSSQFYNIQKVSIDKIKITKRMTDRKNRKDLIYLDVYAENRNIECVLSYKATYKLYNSGWILDDLARDKNGEWIIRPKSEPSENIRNKVIDSDCEFMSKDINLDDLSAIYYYVEPKECGNLKRAIMVHYEFYFDSNIAEWTFNEKQMDFSEDQWNVNNTLWEASIIGSEYRLEILELNTDDKKIRYNLYYKDDDSEYKLMHNQETANLKEYPDKYGYYFNMGYKYNFNPATHYGHLYGVFIGEDEVYSLVTDFLLGGVDTYIKYEQIYDKMPGFSEPTLKCVPVTDFSNYRPSLIPNLENIYFGTSKRELEAKLNISDLSEFDWITMSTSGIYYSGYSSDEFNYNTGIRDLISTMFLFNEADELGGVVLFYDEGNDRFLDLIEYMTSFPSLDAVENVLIVQGTENRSHIELYLKEPVIIIFAGVEGLATFY